MKTTRSITVFILTLLVTLPAWGVTALRKSAEWPFSPPSLFLKGGVNAVTAGSDLVFWAIGDTVAVIDKASFTVQSTILIETSTAIQDVLFDDARDLLFVAAGFDERDQSGGLQIFNVVNPVLPFQVMVYDKSPDNPGARKIYDAQENVIGKADVPDIDARGLGLEGTTLFLADDNFGLRVIDVADPENLTEIPLTTPTADRTSGYKQPDVTGSFTSTGGYVNLSLYPYGEKIYAFVLDYYHGVKVFDVTDPAVIADPVERETLTYIMYRSVSLLSDIFVNETGGRLTAFVTGGDATGTNYVVARLDASFDEQLPIANFGRCITSGEARSVTASGNYAFVADGNAGLTVVDIAAVPEPGNVLTYNKVGTYADDVKYSYNVFLDGPALYLASGQSGLTKLDVTTPQAPAFQDQLDSLITGDDVAVSGNYTYMLDRKRGLRIFDTEEPSYIIFKKFLPLDGEFTDLAVSGNHAYIARKEGTVAVVNIADKNAPYLTGITIAATDPRKLFIAGTRLYIADGTAGLRIVTIATPEAPAQLSLTPTTGAAQSVFVLGSKAYVAEGTSGLQIFNVTNPAAPALEGTAQTVDARDVVVREVDGQDVLVQNNDTYIYALVADGAAGLNILDVTNPGVPLSKAVVDRMDTGTQTPSPFTAVSVATQGEYAFVGMGEDGILVLDLDTNDGLFVFDDPDELTHLTSVSYVRDMIPQTLDKTLYLTVAEGNVGLRILYLYNSTTSDDDDKPFVPTVDAGCFIDTASGSGVGWLPMVQDFMKTVAKTFANWF